MSHSSLKQSESQDLSAGSEWSQGHSIAPLSAAGRSGVPSYTLGAPSSSRPPRTPALAPGARQSRWGAAAREQRAHQDPDSCGSGVHFGDTMNGSGSQGAENTSQEGGSGGWQPEAVLVPLFFALIFLVGTVGNALVLAVLLRHQPVHPQPGRGRPVFHPVLRAFPGHHLHPGRLGVRLAALQGCSFPHLSHYARQQLHAGRRLPGQVSEHRRTIVSEIGAWAGVTTQGIQKA